jgi:hypothetical protein
VQFSVWRYGKPKVSSVPSSNCLGWILRHSTLSGGARTLHVPLQRRLGTGRLHLLVDSTGVKLGDAGEWLVEKHGASRRRSWRKLHIGPFPTVVSPAAN